MRGEGITLDSGIISHPSGCLLRVLTSAKQERVPVPLLHSREERTSQNRAASHRSVMPFIEEFDYVKVRSAGRRRLTGLPQTVGADACRGAVFADFCSEWGGSDGIVRKAFAMHGDYRLDDAGLLGTGFVPAHPLG